MKKQLITGTLTASLLLTSFGTFATLQANATSSNTNSQINSTVNPQFVVTKGKGQALTIQGQTTENLIKNAKVSSTEKKYLNSLVPYFGTSAFLTDKTNSARVDNFVDNKFGVPFYGQGPIYKETYDKVPWTTNRGRIGVYGYTSNALGCTGEMIYTHAYALSALTGKLVNPAEMTALLHVNKLLSDKGLSRTGFTAFYSQFGLRATEYASPNYTKLAKQIKENKGVAIVRLRGYDIGVAFQPSLFVAITDYKVVKGQTSYKLYFPSSHTRSAKWYSEATVKKALMYNAVFVYKDGNTLFPTTK